MTRLPEPILRNKTGGFQVEDCAVAYSEEDNTDLIV